MENKAVLNVLCVCVSKKILICKDKLSLCVLHRVYAVFTSLPTGLFCTQLRLWVVISVVGTRKTSDRSLQVRRDALCSVGNPDCNKARANEDYKCLYQGKSKQDAAAGNSLKREYQILGFLTCDSYCMTRCFKMCTYKKTGYLKVWMTQSV